MRIPFFVRGPGVLPGSRSDGLVSSLDVGATILELAGLAAPGARPTDGRSFAPLLTGNGSWGRDRLLIEYFGWPTDQRLGPCNTSSNELVPGPACPVPPGVPLPLVDTSSNAFSALRIRNMSWDVLYAEYRPSAASPLAPSSTNFTEAYNLTADPWQMVNLALPGGWAPATLAALSAELWAVADCANAACP